MTSPVSELSYRPALDGLRAVAVLAVVAYHLQIGPTPGGFLGVDVFFVLSGYLITSLLLRERTRTGRIDLGKFWARRVRRLLPALIVLCLVVSVWAATWASTNRLGTIRRDLISSLLYVANWNFIVTGQSYFDTFAQPSPLRHTWSLAIEEQFYLLWPATVLVLLAARRGLRKLAVITAVAAVASVVCEAVLYNATDSSRAYYGTDARAHELFVGALLAMVLHRFGSSLRARVAQSGASSALLVATGWLGAALLLVGIVRLSDHAAAYYRGGSLAMSLAVAGMIVAVELGPSGILARLLSLPPAVAIGKVSYGLYLWHWPVQVWLTRKSTGVHGIELTLLRLAVASAACVASYFLVERPIRRGSVGSVRLTPRRLAAIVPVSTALAVLIATQTTAGATDGDRVQVGKPLAKGSGLTVAVVGDSVAASLEPGLKDLAQRHAWTLLPAAFPGCSASGGFQLDDHGQPFTWSSRCARDVPRAQQDLVRTYKPDVVLWYSARELEDLRGPNGEQLRTGSARHWAAVEANVQETLQRLQAGGARVVIVLPAFPAVAVEGTCARKGGQCKTHDGNPDLVRQLRDALTRIASTTDGVRVVDDLHHLLCGDASGRCPATVDGVVLRPDGFHFTEDTARRVVTAIEPRLLSAVEAA